MRIWDMRMLGAGGSTTTTAPLCLAVFRVHTGAIIRLEWHPLERVRRGRGGGRGTGGRESPASPGEGEGCRGGGGAGTGGQGEGGEWDGREGQSGGGAEGQEGGGGEECTRGDYEAIICLLWHQGQCRGGGAGGEGVI